MKVKAKIFQIVKWEERESYFNYVDYGDVPVDLLHLEYLDEGRLKWYENFLWIFTWLFPKKQRKVFKYYNFMFTQQIYDTKGNFRFNALPLLVPSSNDYKVGDIVEIDYNINKIEELKEKENNEVKNVSRPVE